MAKKLIYYDSVTRRKQVLDTRAGGNYSEIRDVPPSFTTAQRDALTGVVGGSIIFNSTTSKLNFYTGAAWEAVTSA